jgi:hypothetical protein
MMAQLLIEHKCSAIQVVHWEGFLGCRIYEDLYLNTEENMRILDKRCFILEYEGKRTSIIYRSVRYSTVKKEVDYWTKCYWLDTCERIAAFRKPNTYEVKSWRSIFHD